MTDLQAADINRIAAAVARELTPDSAPPPVITIGGVDAAGALNGSVDIAIIIGGTTYTLKMQTPSPDNKEEYVFTLAMTPDKGKETVIGGFKYKSDGTGWQVAVGLPEIVIGSVTIKTLKVELGQGSV